jgi:hypothetical protein
MVAPAGVQGVEVRDAVDTEHDGFAIQDELLLPDLPRRLDDPGIPAGPVMATLREQPDAVSVALDAEARPEQPSWPWVRRTQCAWS